MDCLGFVSGSVAHFANGYASAKQFKHVSVDIYNRQNQKIEDQKK